MRTHFIIPETIIYNALNFGLDWIRNDIDTNSAEWLNLMFGENDLNGNSIMLGDVPFLDQAIEIFKRDTDHNRNLQVHLGYTAERTGVPAISIVLPTDTPGPADGIGMDEGYFYNDDATTYKSRTYYTRSYQADYSVIIHGENQLEVICVAQVLRAFIIAYHHRLEDLGLRNIKITTRDIRMDSSLVPMNIFHRTVSLSFLYEISIPALGELERTDKVKITANKKV